MKIFLSWSGERSRLIATELKSWLRYIINETEPFMSMDIEAGARWQNAIAAELASTQFGIVLVTKDNQDSRWLNFEAGALAKTIDASRVIPLAIDLDVSEIHQPLGQFQAQPMTNTGVRNIINAINAHCSRALPSEHLDAAFSLWWPKLEQIVTQACKGESSSLEAERPEGPDLREALNEILASVRQMIRSNLNPTDARYAVLGRTIEKKERSIATEIASEAAKFNLDPHIDFRDMNRIDLMILNPPWPDELVANLKAIALAQDYSITFTTKAEIGW